MITETTMDKQKITMEMETPGVSPAKMQMQITNSLRETLDGAILIIINLVQTRTIRTRAGVMQIQTTKTRGEIPAVIQTTREITGIPAKMRTLTQEEIPTTKAILAGITPITV